MTTQKIIYPYAYIHTGGEDSTSTESSQSDSTGGSRRGLVNESKQNSNKMTSWDSDDKLHPQGAQVLNLRSDLFLFYQNII